MQIIATPRVRRARKRERSGRWTPSPAGQGSAWYTLGWDGLPNLLAYSLPSDPSDRRVPRPIEALRRPQDTGPRHKPPMATVLAIIAIIPQHKVVVLLHN